MYVYIYISSCVFILEALRLWRQVSSHIHTNKSTTLQWSNDHHRPAVNHQHYHHYYSHHLNTTQALETFFHILNNTLRCNVTPLGPVFIISKPGNQSCSPNTFILWLGINMSCEIKSNLNCSNWPDRMRGQNFKSFRGRKMATFVTGHAEMPACLFIMASLFAVAYCDCSTHKQSVNTVQSKLKKQLCA